MMEIARPTPRTGIARPASAPTPLAELLAQEIAAHGPITFAEFMRACLYHPEHGYYTRPDATRLAQADYATSVDLHPIFGRLLARQLAEMWRAMGAPAEFWLVEGGAGTGRLAAHILDFAMRDLPDFYGAVRYCAVELSAARRAEHRAAIGRHIEAGRAESCAELPETIPAGVIFSNELLDALPVHRVARSGGELREIYVALDGDGRLKESAGPVSTPALVEYFREQGIELAEGQQAEAGLEAARWIEDAGHRLARGFILTVDYGYAARELYDAARAGGTLLGYERHRTTEDWFRAPGEQDLTAHVNFTAVEMAGRRVGLEPVGLVSQSHFLLALAGANQLKDFEDPGASEVERYRTRLAFQELIHPDGMGEAFRVLVQEKGIRGARLAGLLAI
ncbi:MAG: SAM-dependent methyltransferase [Candidatus Acidiferrales bacterium]